MDFWEELKSGKFLSMVKESSKGQTLMGSIEAYNVIKPLFAQEDDVEKMFFIFLNRKNTILSIEDLFRGSLTGSAVYPREVIKRIIALKAASFVMAHNHPSGDPQPSPEDLRLTLDLLIGMHAIGVQIIDHIIIGTYYHSMADMGNLKNMKNRIEEFYKAL